jgi:hypothetical protein
MIKLMYLSLIKKGCVSFGDQNITIPQLAECIVHYNVSALVLKNIAIELATADDVNL